MSKEKFWDIVGAVSLIGFLGLVLFMEDILLYLYKLTGGN